MVCVRARQQGKYGQQKSAPSVELLVCLRGRSKAAACYLHFRTPLNETDNYMPRLAGFARTFEVDSLRLDIVTIKGGCCSLSQLLDACATLSVGRLRVRVADSHVHTRFCVYFSVAIATQSFTQSKLAIAKISEFKKFIANQQQNNNKIFYYKTML